jgi:hypothetical protein
VSNKEADEELPEVGGYQLKALIATGCGDRECPARFTIGRHYHCGSCAEVTGYQGHFVGGNAADARVICDREERAAYVMQFFPRAPSRE